jgi:hypothetical protein
MYQLKKVHVEPLESGWDLQQFFAFLFSFEYLEDIHQLKGFIHINL